MTNIAFIGLGNMGGPMAANLVKAQHRVVGFDLGAAVCEQAKADGVAIAGTAREAVADAEVIVTMLPAGRHVLAVWSDILPAARPGTLVIDSSTIDVESARKAHALAAESGLLSPSTRPSPAASAARRRPRSPSWPEAPARLSRRPSRSSRRWASASSIAARRGRAGGQDLQQHDPRHLDDRRLEAFVLAERLGLSHQALFDVASTSGQCWSLTTYCPVPGPVPTSPANNGYKPGFAAALMLKDLKLAQEAALASGAATPLGAEAAQLYALFNAAGHADDDFSGIINFVRGSRA